MTELEQNILETAERLFLERGFNGTSTTDIARAVGCNQALVHYYYRTKEKLFSAIYIQKVDQLLQYAESYTYETDFFSSLKQLVGAYFDFLNQHRQIPFFIINELAINKERREQIRELVICDPKRQQLYDSFDKIVQNEVRKGTIRPIETFDLLINCLSLVVTNFLTLPIVRDVLQKSEEEVNVYLDHRKQEILLLLTKGLSA